tara:strand:+ start:4772 stop:5584 length:813 start_codon:yes stop_codon:yes gene_type:complete
MRILKLKEVEHKTKVGKECPYIEPNVSEDCLLEVDGEIIGFYIKDVKEYSKKLNLLLAIANKEFKSDNVHKTKMDRSDVFEARKKNPNLTRSEARELGTSQMSVILGSTPPRPQMGRPYPNISIIHRDKKAQTFIKAMWGACLEAEQIIKKLTPHLYENQVELFKDVKQEWKFGTLYTSSISNFNISAPFHRDTGNIKGTVNIILTKRNNSKGGCLNVPDYNATFEQADNSMLVYPAWRNIHGVTPIKQITEDGYRNSLIFYGLKAFKGI